MIEASGVAQPEKIAVAAQAEPEMRYSGIVTLADAANLAALLRDPEIGVQVRGQLAVADLVVLTKTDLVPAEPARELVAGITGASITEAAHGAVDVDFLLDRPAGAPAPGGCSAGAG